MSTAWPPRFRIAGNKCRMAENKCRIAGNKCRIVGLVVAVTLTAACGGSDEPPPPPQSLPSVITVSSQAFNDGQQIPRAFTCDGAGDSPPLRWSGLPPASGSVALVVDDPDASGGTFVHWLVRDIAPSVTGVGRGQIPEGGAQVTNSSDAESYFGPCPPSGSHHYRFTVYALPRGTQLPPGASMDETLTAIYDHAIASGRLIGLYAHPG
jgi:Raf kinase inhibitor-like YbhB/YbcL family protein